MPTGRPWPAFGRHDAGVEPVARRERILPGRLVLLELQRECDRRRASIICGADGVVVDSPLLIALECRLCYRCRKDLSCPAKIDNTIDPLWGSQRMINLMGAWHNQLIEVMGAMGIREARRLRGEVGRSMWFEDLEMESFGPIFGKRKTAGFK